MTLHPGDPTVLHLRVPNKVVFDTIGTVLKQLEPMLRTGSMAPPRRVLLDMTRVSSCSPTGITILAAALEDLFLRGLLNGGEIELPDNPLLVEYLQQMNFFEELNVKLPGELEATPTSVHPVTHVKDETVSPAATRALVATLQQNADLDEGSVNGLKTCLNEVIENVFYHAQSPTDALVSAQAYKAKRRTELVIADTGQGIRAALSKIPKYAKKATDDCSAIRLAIQKNVTTTGDRRRGIGLWVASEVIRRNKGELLILSHEGGVRIGSNGAHDVTDHFWPGTLVVIEFRTDMPISPLAVYDSGEFPDADHFDF
jgi:anti-sigma regulatory factor (Ser/Thr protein kinase)